MKRIKKRQLIVGGLLATLVVLAGATTTYAFAGDFGPSSEERQAVEEAIANGDYDSWKSLMESKISQENFAKIQERYQSREQMRVNQEATRAAMEAGDYSAWQKAIEGTPMANQNIDEATFKKMVEAHKLMQSGDREGARAIFDELKDAGFGPRPGFGKRERRGFRPGGMEGIMRGGFDLKSPEV